MSLSCHLLSSWCCCHAVTAFRGLFVLFLSGVALLALRLLSFAVSTTFGIEPAFENDSTTVEQMQLPEGAHVIHYFDSYGDGWHGGYWTIKDCRGNVIAGGETAGLVANMGGETEFNAPYFESCGEAGSGGGEPAPSPPPAPPVGTTDPRHISSLRCASAVRVHCPLIAGLSTGVTPPPPAPSPPSGGVAVGVEGCTYAAATNYNWQATVDDGSCVYAECPEVAPVPPPPPDRCGER